MSKNRGKKKLRRETWNLDHELIKWINTHFTAYKIVAAKHIDLSFYKFNYKGKVLTQAEIIDRIIEITNYLIKEDYQNLIWNKEDREKVEDFKNEMFDLLKLVIWCMWW